MRSGGLWSSLGSLGAAVLGSACCWLPFLLLALGVGASSLGAMTPAIEYLRPLLATLAIGLLGGAFYLTYLRRRPVAAASADETCCSPQVQEALCGCCNGKGRRVPARTVRALVREPLRHDVREGNYVLCLNPSCAQVYTAPTGGRPFVKQDLAIRVGYKEQQAPHLVCYCLGYSVEAIEAELRALGCTTIPERIRAEVEAGRCACEVENPQGSCCLGDVNRVVREAQDRIAGKAAAPVAAPAIPCAPPPAAEQDHADGCVPRRGRRAQRPGAALPVRLNKMLLPIVSVLVLATLFLPHQVFSFLQPSRPSGPAVGGAGDIVVLRVPGMS